MSRRTVVDVPATPHFDFLYGAFQLSKWRIPYLSTTMTVEEAAESLNLTAEMPGAESIRWRLDELFQRDIDWPRVERQVLPYLRNVEQPQFFNSITVALLPYNDSTAELQESFHGDYEWNPPPLVAPATPYARSLEVGPVSLGFWDNWHDPSDDGIRSGRLRWNHRQIFGVAIDGQHRLAALKMLAQNTHHGAGTGDTRVPIILLLFAPELGFSSPEENSQVDLLRMLFIDLNKHAQTVSRARQILLDDRDPHAVCVRRLVSDQLCDDIGDLTADIPRLPLSLIDWHSEQAKFDTGPYISTVLGLDWMVAQVLGSQPIGDYTNYPAIQRQINQLRRTLEVSLTSAEERLIQLQSSQLSPFSYSESELDEIGSAFAEIWCQPLCTVLTQLSPYAELLIARHETNSLSLDFQHWYELRERADADSYQGRAWQSYRQLLGRLTHRAESPVAESTLEDGLAVLNDTKSGVLAFNVAFQRALVDGFLEFAKIGRDHVDELFYWSDEDYFEDVDFDDDIEEDLEWDEDGSEEPSAEISDEQDPEVLVDSDTTTAGLIAERAKEFVSALNRFFEAWPEALDLEASMDIEEDADTLEVPFWLGSLRNAEGGVDFTQAASRRAKDLLFCVAALALYDDITDPGAGSDFDAFWSLCDGNEAPAVCKRVARAIRRFAQEKGAGGRILAARGDDYSEDVASLEAYVRLRCIWKVLDL